MALLFVVLVDVSDVDEDDPVLVPVPEVVGHLDHAFGLLKQETVLQVLEIALHDFRQIL